MSRRLTLAMVLVAGACAVNGAFAQQNRPYNELMKEIAAAYASVKKNLDAGTGPAAAPDAARLQALFKEAEAFWVQFKTKDAIDAARGAHDASAALAAAAKANSIQKALASYNGVGKFCAACHASHREQMPDKTYRIKP